MAGRLKKVEYAGYVQLASGAKFKFPPAGRLDIPWTETYIHNQSAFYVNVGFDKDVDPRNDFTLFDWDWRDFVDLRVNTNITFYCASAASIFLMGFSDYPESQTDIYTSEDSTSPLARRPMVRDRDFQPLPVGPAKPPEKGPPTLRLLADIDADDLEPEV